MITITPDISTNSAPAPIFDESIVKRAMARYLPETDPAPDLPADLEPTLNHVLDFLRCASATVYELGENLSGTNRDLASASMHMLELAKVMLERSLNGTAPR